MVGAREYEERLRAGEAALLAHAPDAPSPAACDELNLDDTLAAESSPECSNSDDDGAPIGVAEGSMLTDTIRLCRAIGAGGMGSVWQADHLGLQIPVAVKFLKRSLAEHRGAVARFHREAAAAARIKSPHVVQVFDHGVAPCGTAFIVMELLEGETLDALLARRGTLSLNETAEIVRQVASVLSKAHELGVVHRDIKPENLFLVSGESQPFVKVLDFGIAKLDSDDQNGHVTIAGSVVGTPQYMAPEQMTGHGRVGPASDVWALGVVSYVCLTGLLPYEGSSLAEIAVSIDRGALVPAAVLSDEVSDAVDAWLQRALEPSLSRRFASARAMSEGLEEALALDIAAAVAPPAQTSSPFPLVVRTQPDATRPTFLRGPLAVTLAARETGRRRRWAPFYIAMAAAVALLGIGAANSSTKTSSPRTGPPIPNHHPPRAVTEGVSTPPVVVTSESVPSGEAAPSSRESPPQAASSSSAGPLSSGPLFPQLPRYRVLSNAPRRRDLGF
jgi:eukaryotic-like serine/threonine-protein kinase